jgi:hypothetical protein
MPLESLGEPHAFPIFFFIINYLMSYDKSKKKKIREREQKAILEFYPEGKCCFNRVSI